ncbi:putative phosphatase regulatory subunit [Rhodofomes roseus]|uniref:Phosphatase regulatory subunit n=1 Tax=Rhodofomes roseus TaxID=34475 RepID=A0ABQ8K139_9APHY|nr:putative phosphatase regulatory subunit [Rhodofomes roseus]KAH9830422.1 putative phosphatase regulatory subunit [Rhodofomes roseus]
MLTAQDVADLRQPSPHANVHLETLTLPRTRPLALRGTVLVRNLHFEKRVAVRFTLDNWQTTSEVLCRHILNLASLPSLATQKSCTVDLTAENMDGQTKAGEGKGSWDRFGFTIQLDYDHRLADHALYLVVSYASGTAEWWDNDDGQNYKIRFCRAFVATAQSQ